MDLNTEFQKIKMINRLFGISRLKLYIWQTSYTKGSASSLQFPFISLCLRAKPLQNQEDSGKQNCHFIHFKTNHFYFCDHFFHSLSPMCVLSPRKEAEKSSYTRKSACISITFPRNTSIIARFYKKYGFSPFI